MDMLDVVLENYPKSKAELFEVIRRPCLSQ
jgi:hypothetical protein